jgi:hypothetical protein
VPGRGAGNIGRESSGNGDLHVDRRLRSPSQAGWDRSRDSTTGGLAGSRAARPAETAGAWTARRRLQRIGGRQERLPGEGNVRPKLTVTARLRRLSGTPADTRGRSLRRSS